jgi:hypothetical protein
MSRFGRRVILCVGEPGLSVKDAPASVAALKARQGMASYREQPATFAPVGDEHGPILVVALGRSWNLVAIPARVAPVTLRVRGDQGERHHLLRLPYDPL